MAESGGISGILGAEPEAAVEGSVPETGLDPAAVALAAEAANVIGIGALLMIRNAVEAHGVVIEAFQVPPGLAQRGLTGEVIAEQVLDQLADLEGAASSSSARPAGSYSNSWGHDLKVEIPETGVSFGELNRYLREAWGHESHILGEIYETPTGITVTARTAGKQSNSFSGRTDDLGQLVRRAAESIG